jgi:NTE family protein
MLAWPIINRDASRMTDFASIFAKPATQGESTHVGAAGLCLSGGGYRAMLFHVGALRRLHEVGALQELAGISSVSGGSITAAVLARGWQELSRADGAIEPFEELVQQPLYAFAGERVNVSAVLKGILTPARRVSDFVAAAYRPLLGDFSLQQLPDAPRFVFLATNLASGVRTSHGHG